MRTLLLIDEITEEEIYEIELAKETHVQVNSEVHLTLHNPYGAGYWMLWEGKIVKASEQGQGQNSIIRATVMTVNKV